MIRHVIFLFFLTSVLSAIICFDRVTVESNKKFSNFSISLSQNEKRSAIVNVTIDLYKPLKKMLVYVKISENKHDHQFKREFRRTVVDVEKLSKGRQLNFLVAAYMENVQKFLDFELRFPLQPVGV